MKYELIEFTGDNVIKPIRKYLALAMACRDALTKNIEAGEARFAVRRVASNTIVHVGMIR